MYVSIRDALLLNDEFSSPLEGLRHLGLDAIEIALNPEFTVCAIESHATVTLDSIEAARDYGERLAELGVRPVAFLTACDFSAEDREAEVRWLIRAVELAHAAGMKVIRVDAAMARERELDFSTRVELFATGLGQVLEATHALDVALGIENHGYQGNNLAFLLNVFKRVGSARLGMTLDSGNFYWRGYPLSEVYGILEILAPYTKHTHLKNIRYPEDQREVTRDAGWEYGTYVSPLDEGDIDHGVVIRLLARHGYTGDLCIEDESLDRYASGEERTAVLRRDVQHVKEVLDSLGNE